MGCEIARYPLARSQRPAWLAITALNVPSKCNRADQPRNRFVSELKQHRCVLLIRSPDEDAEMIASTLSLSLHHAQDRYAQFVPFKLS
jgi:hypothetical protein